MSRTTGDVGRYQQFRPHYWPRTGRGRAVVAVYIALFLFAEWPLLPLANRIEPRVFGFPFIFAYLAVIYVGKIVTLLYAARRQL